MMSANFLLAIGKWGDDLSNAAKQSSRKYGKIRAFKPRSFSCQQRWSK